jgi:peptidyl-prolyl cis-trans isomerase D
MLSSFRRLSKSTVGTGIMIVILLLILVGFAMGDIQSVIRGGGIGGGSDTLVKVGSQSISDRDVTRAMERRLSQVRQENAEATYSTIAGDFDPLLSALVDAKTLEVFAARYGFSISKRLVDGQIATLPGTKGLNGQFSDQAYAQFLQQQRMTDEDVRMIIRNGLYQQLVIAPAAVNARAPVGMATPYASVLLEGRQGEVTFVPTAAFKAGLNPTQSDLDRFYATNKQRYVVPEQRVLRVAKIGPEQVANVQATDKEIADYYNQNRALYAPKETRVISRVIVPDQATASAIVNRVRSGQTFAAASAPAGFSAADISVGPQTREQLTELAGQQIATAAFAAQEGGLVGPIQSDVGWNVVKIDGITREGGKSLEAARSEIASKIETQKRKAAVEDLVTKLEDSLDEGASFGEAVAAAKLTPLETPLITGDGRSQTTPDYKLPADLAPALKSGFELAENDQPVVETLPNDGGYVLVSPARIVPSAPAPLASIRDKVAQDWINNQASQRAKQLADSIGAKAAKSSMADAAKGANVPVRVEPVKARRIQLAQFRGQVPPPLMVLFSLNEGKVRTVSGGQGEGFYVVKLNKIEPGNALAAPSLVTQTSNQMSESLSQEYGLQFLNAMRETAGVNRNEKAIAAAKARIIGGGN